MKNDEQMTKYNENMFKLLTIQKNLKTANCGGPSPLSPIFCQNLTENCKKNQNTKAQLQPRAEQKIRRAKADQLSPHATQAPHKRNKNLKSETKLKTEKEGRTNDNLNDDQ